ncbi:hypothetical protein PO909_006177 [Leuciscus waleckii]
MPHQCSFTETSGGLSELRFLRRGPAGGVDKADLMANKACRARRVERGNDSHSRQPPSASAWSACSFPRQEAHSSLLSPSLRTARHEPQDVETISALRCQLSSSQSGGTVQQLRLDRDELGQEVQHLRVQFRAAQTIRRKQLTKLTVQSNNAAKKLQETVALVRVSRFLFFRGTLRTEGYEKVREKFPECTANHRRDDFTAGKRKSQINHYCHSMEKRQALATVILNNVYFQSCRDSTGNQTDHPTLIKELGLQGHATSQQDLKTPKTGSGTDAGQVTAATWQFFEDMHEVLGGRPSMDPPVVIASFRPDADPITILMEIVEPSSPDTASDTANTSVASPVATPNPSPKKKRRKSIVEFLIEESAKEQKRHEESEAKMDRFLGLFEKLIDKI